MLFEFKPLAGGNRGILCNAPILVSLDKTKHKQTSAVRLRLSEDVVRSCRWKCGDLINVRFDSSLRAFTLRRVTAAADGYTLTYSGDSPKKKRGHVATATLRFAIPDEAVSAIFAGDSRRYEIDTFEDDGDKLTILLP
jgi:hypothetical protein